jgi:hypothetical protein
LFKGGDALRAALPKKQTHPGNKGIGAGNEGVPFTPRARGKRAGSARAKLAAEKPVPVQSAASPKTSKGPAIAKATLTVRAGASEDTERVACGARTRDGSVAARWWWRRADAASSPARQVGKVPVGQRLMVSHVESGDGDAVRAQIDFDKNGNTVTGFVTAVRSNRKGGGVLLVEDVHFDQFLKRHEHAHWKPETLAAATALTQKAFYMRMLKAGYDPDTTDWRTKGDHGMPSLGFLTADPND